MKTECARRWSWVLTLLMGLPGGDLVLAQAGLTPDPEIDLGELEQRLTPYAKGDLAESSGGVARTAAGEAGFGRRNGAPGKGGRRRRQDAAPRKVAAAPGGEDHPVGPPERRARRLDRQRRHSRRYRRIRDVLSAPFPASRWTPKTRAPSGPRSQAD